MSLSLVALEVGLTESQNDYSLKCRPTHTTSMSFLSRDPVTGNIEIDALVRRRRWKDAESILVRILSEAAKTAVAPTTATTTTTPILNDSPEIQSTKLMLAHIFRQVGRPRDAEELDSEVLETRQRLLGPDAQDTLTAMNHLATDIKLQPERLLEGLTLEKNVLEAAIQVFWVDNDGGATQDSHHRKKASSSSFSSISSSSSSSSSAATTTSAAVLPPHSKSSTTTSIDRSPAMDILIRMCRLADTLFIENQAASAAKLHETVLRLCTTSLGPGHPYTIAVMDSTGRDYVSQGRISEAARLLQDAVEAGRVHLGARDSTTRRCIVHLAEVHGRMTAEGDGKVLDAKAIGVLEQGVQILEESIGVEERDTISLKYYLAIAYARLDGRFGDSEALQEQVLRWCRHSQNADSEIANLIVRNLSLLHRQLGRMDKARQVETEFGPIRRSSS